MECKGNQGHRSRVLEVEEQFALDMIMDHDGVPAT
jgi:hypothetical protein